MDMLDSLQGGAKPNSKAARAMANVQRGTDMAAAHATSQPAPAPAPQTTAAAAAESNAKKSAGKKDKEYMPRKGTANYAFLICMFRGHKLGQDFYGKEELMQLAESSGLADKPIHGANAAAAVHAGNVQQSYNGWSCFTVRSSFEVTSCPCSSPPPCALQLQAIEQ